MSSKELKDYVQDGLIGHQYKEDRSKLDFGDSSAECGRYWFIIFIINRLGLRFSFDQDKQDFENACSKLEIDNSGIWRRHPTQYNEPNDWSRDQETPIIIALAAYGIKDRLTRLYNKHLSRFPRCQNKDILVWEYSLFWRGLEKWWFYPLILILDLGLVVNSIIRVIKAKFSDDDVGDCLNHQLHIIYALEKYPTPTAHLAKVIYKLRKRGMFYPWDYYYRHPENPPIDEFAKFVVLSRL